MNSFSSVTSSVPSSAAWPFTSILPKPVEVAGELDTAYVDPQGKSTVLLTLSNPFSPDVFTLPGPPSHRLCRTELVQQCLVVVEPLTSKEFLPEASPGIVTPFSCGARKSSRSRANRSPAKTE